ncbi:MAG: hypothetical protein ABW065_13675 [Solirubrobacterales bacterium]
MPTVLAIHEVEDVDKWRNSSKREEVFGPLGITVRTFEDQKDTNRVGLVMEVPDIAALQEVLGTPAAAEAMQHDGVRPETLVILEES